MENIVYQCYNSNDQDAVLNQIWPSYVFHTTHSLPGAGIDRLPFQVCPQNSVYHTLQKMSNNSLRYATNHIFQQITKCNKAIHCNHLPCVELHKWEGMLRSWTTKRFCFNAFLYKCKKSNFNKIGRCHQIKQISIEKNILFFKTKRTHWQAEIFVL